MNILPTTKYRNEPFEVFHSDYLNAWDNEIGEAIFQTSWDFLEGRHQRIIMFWLQKTLLDKYASLSLAFYKTFEIIEKE